MSNPIEFKSEAFNNLKPQYQIFILSYLKHFNATQAAIDAKYSKKAARRQGSFLLTNQDILRGIKEISREIMNAVDVAEIQEIGQFLTYILRGNIKDVVSWDESGLIWTAGSDEMKRETSSLIKKIKVTEKKSQKGDWTECKTEVELHDPIKAAELLGKYRGMFAKENEEAGKTMVNLIIEHSGDKGKSVDDTTRKTG